MAVITISRLYGSRGREIARLVCDRLGYRYFDKGLMAQLGAEMGLPPDQLTDLPEHKHQARSLVDRLFSRVINPFADLTQMAYPAVLEARQQESVETFQRLIRAAYEHGQVVVMGGGGQAMLQDAPDVLVVRGATKDDKGNLTISDTRNVGRPWGMLGSDCHTNLLR